MRPAALYDGLGKPGLRIAKGNCTSLSLRNRLGLRALHPKAKVISASMSRNGSVRFAGAVNGMSAVHRRRNIVAESLDSDGKEKLEANESKASEDSADATTDLESGEMRLVLVTHSL